CVGIADRLHQFYEPGYGTFGETREGGGRTQGVGVGEEWAYRAVPGRVGGDDRAGLRAGGCACSRGIAWLQCANGDGYTPSAIERLLLAGHVKLCVYHGVAGGKQAGLLFVRIPAGEGAKRDSRRACGRLAEKSAGGGSIHVQCRLDRQYDHRIQTDRIRSSAPVGL